MVTHEEIPHPPVPGASPQDAESNKFVAALSWLWILSVVILLVKKDSPYVQFHARQSFLLFILSILLWVFLSFFGPLAWFLQWLLKAAVFALIVIGFLQALRGRWWTVPVIGSFAQNVRL